MEQLEVKRHRRARGARGIRLARLDGVALTRRYARLRPGTRGPQRVGQLVGLLARLGARGIRIGQSDSAALVRRYGQVRPGSRYWGYVVSPIL